MTILCFHKTERRLILLPICILQFFLLLHHQLNTVQAAVEPRRNAITTQRSIAGGVSTIPRSILDLDRIDLNCPVECACQRGYINCTARSLHYVPSKNRRTNYTTFLPHAMWLNDNPFGGAITAKNFSDWLMLKTLSLRNCSVKRVAALTFASMPRLAVLDLSSNRGGMLVDALAFSGTNLEALLLDDNPGIVFSEKSFENATIRSVRIRRCKLTTLSPDVFLPLASSVESLIISENEIGSLNQRFESLFTSISFFDVSKNPWVCDCAVEWLTRVFVNRLNRTRSLNPVDEWGSASSHGLPVPACATPSQRHGTLIDALRLGTSDFACTAASVIGIDVEQLRERNQTRFRCSAAGDPVAMVSWHFPRAEDEYNWALSLVENTTTVISPSAFASPSSAGNGGIVIVSQAFLTVMNRPAISVSSNGFASSNQVRLICRAVNPLGSASLMTNFDVTQRAHDSSSSGEKKGAEAELGPSTPRPVRTTPKRLVSSTGPRRQTAATQRPKMDSVTPKLLSETTKYSRNVVLLSTNIPIGGDPYDPIWVEGSDGGSSDVGDAEQQQNGAGWLGEEESNSTTSVVTKWQDGENMGMNQQSIPQGILVTVAVLVAIVMSSLGGCCLVIACSTSKVPNCPNIKRAPSRCREPSIFLSPSTIVLAAQQAHVEAANQSLAQQSGSAQDRRPLLKPRYNTKPVLAEDLLIPPSSNNNNNSNQTQTDQNEGHRSSSKKHRRKNGSNNNNSGTPSNQIASGGGVSPNTSSSRHPYSPPQTFTTFRSAPVVDTSEQNQQRPVVLSAFRQGKPFESAGEQARDDAYFDSRNDSKRRYHSYYGRHRNNPNGLNLFLSPPPPAPPPMMDDIALNDCGADINRNSSNSYPGDMAAAKQRDRFFSTNSQSELCTCSPDFNKDKKSSSGYRSLALTNGGGSDDMPDDLDTSAGTSGIRSSEPCDEPSVHPVACFSPIHGNDIVRKTCLPVAAEEITFI